MACSRTQHSASGEARTKDLGTLALSHCAPLTIMQFRLDPGHRGFYSFELLTKIIGPCHVISNNVAF